MNSETYILSHFQSIIFIYLRTLSGVVSGHGELVWMKRTPISGGDAETLREIDRGQISVRQNVGNGRIWIVRHTVIVLAVAEAHSAIVAFVRHWRH